MTLSIMKLFHYTECHCAECRDLLIGMLNVVMLSVVRLNIVRLNVIMLTVVAPQGHVTIGICARDSHHCTCLGHLGWHDTDRIIYILCHTTQYGQGKLGRCNVNRGCIFIHVRSLYE